MRSLNVTRRKLLKASLAALGVIGLTRRSPGAFAAVEVKVPESIPEVTVDFATQNLASWTTVTGQWAVEDMAGAPGGRKVLVQRATRNEFNVIVSPAGPYTDVDVSMKFKPISGREDASGGIVFRVADGRYYVVRANALESNFRLYYYDRGRHQLATASVAAPALGRWHQLRVIAVGDRIQAALDGAVLLNHRDRRFASGRIGLWTKADSVTAFTDLTIRGVAAR